MYTDPHVGVNLFLQAPDLSQMLPYSLLEVQNTAALLLRVTGDLQLETHTLLSLTVFLHQEKHLILAQDINLFLFLAASSFTHLSSGFHVEK